MSTEASDQPVAEEEHVSTEETGVATEATEAQGDDQELDEDGNPIEGQAEDDSEEIEHDGIKAKLPKALAKEFREGTLRQQDYTRKTQEIAEQRRTVEARAAELQQQAELHETTLEERATLKQVEASLQQYEGMNWQQYTSEYGADATAAAMAQWRQLEAAKGHLHTEITRKQDAHRLESERRSATALQEADTVLSREITGYGPELVRKVAETAQSLGFSAQELRESLIGADGKADTRSFKVLARLQAAETELAALKAKTTKAQTAEKQAAITPAKVLKPNAGQYKPGLADDLPMDEWMRRANAKARAG